MNNNAKETIRYFKEYSKLLPKEDDDKLLVKAKKGDKEAMSALILKNMGLIIKISLNYQGNGLEDEDLIQEGITGFIKGIKKYKEEKGVKLTSYAAIWVKAAVTRAITNKGGLIRIPARRTEILWEYVKIKNKYSNEDITDSEIAEIMNVNEKLLADILNGQNQLLSLDAAAYKKSENKQEKNLIDTLIADEGFEDIIEDDIVNQQFLKCINEKTGK